MNENYIKEQSDDTKSGEGECNTTEQDIAKPSEKEEKSLKKQRKREIKRERKEEKKILKQGAKVQKKILSETKKIIKREKKQIEKKTPAVRYSGSYLFSEFNDMTFAELEQAMLESDTREERAFYRALLNLKLQIEQEKIIGEVLL